MKNSIYIYTKNLEIGVKVENIINEDLNNTSTLKVKYNFITNKYDLIFRKRVVSNIDNYIFNKKQNEEKVVLILFGNRKG